MTVRAIAAIVLLVLGPASNALAQALAEYSRALAPGQAGRGAVQSLGDSVRRGAGRVSLSEKSGGASAKSGASVSVTSNVSGGAVTIDGVDHGPLPLEGLALAPGPHAVKVMKYGYRDWRTTLDVKEGRPATLDVRMEKIRF